MSRVLVTGGGTGIGRGIAQALVAAGYTVCINGRRAELLNAAAAELGATAVPGDITTDAEAIIAAARPDHLVNNAGFYRHAPLGTWSAALFESLYRVHVVGPALLAQAFAAQLDGPGSVTNIASTLAQRPAPGAAAYAAAKAGLVQLTRQLALEGAARGVRANALLPGVVPTDMTAADRDGQADLSAHFLALHPIGRLGTPADVGAAVVWLVQAPWVTGAAIPVDGGLLVRE
jgi:NAD(P)-dependent dehydrogenase (short-subunit alcohol dehydrogenase family)